ncbi:MAG: DNA replication protein [Candidatus Pelagibacter sp.]
MKDLNQLLLNFNYKQNFNYDDFYVSKSNFYAFAILEKWPKWEKNILNIYGEKFCGKSHLANIFCKKNNSKKIEEKQLNDDILKELKLFEIIVLDNFENITEERILYALFNLIDSDNKYLLINSLVPINQIEFKLNDLKSRSKNCLFAKIDSPDDDLMFAIILKNLSDRQITIDKKLIDFIIKRIDRSYGKIAEFIYKIDELSLKKKKTNRL